MSMPQDAGWRRSQAAVPTSVAASSVSATVRSAIGHAVEHTLGSGAPADWASPLMELGLDSLASTELVRVLGEQLRTELSSTLLFDHPTPEAVSSHMEHQLAVAELVAVAEVENETTGPLTLEPALPVKGCGFEHPQASMRVFHTGEIGMVPGAWNSTELRATISGSRNNATTIPAERWDLDTLGRGAIIIEVGRRASYGGFIRTDGGVNSVIFGLSPKEATAMDPHQ